jgi:hypothetical protein
MEIHMVMVVVEDEVLFNVHLLILSRLEQVVVLALLLDLAIPIFQVAQVHIMGLVQMEPDLPLRKLVKVEH